MALSFKIYRSTKALPPEWDATLHPQHPLHSTQVSLCEASDIEHMNYFYVTTYYNNQLVLCSYFQQLRLKVSHFNCNNKFLQWVSLQAVIGTIRPSLLVAGNLFSHDAFYVQPIGSYHEDEACAWYLDTIEEVMQISRATGVFIKDLPDAQSKVMQRHPRFTPMQNDITMMFNIPAEWHNMTDYEKALKHKYLQRFKKTRRMAESLTVKRLTPAEIEQEKDIMNDLYRQVSDHQLVSMGKINAAYYPAMQARLGTDYHVHAWYQQNKMLAFSTAIVRDGIYDMNYIGFDYAANAEYSIYFNILFHCMQHAIESGCQRLVLGRTALEAKAILGCHAESMHGYYRLRHPLVRRMFNLISKQFNNQWGDTWQGRHPFKSAYYQQLGQAIGSNE